MTGKALSFVLAAIAAVIVPNAAMAVCPSAHLQPTLVYGVAFPESNKVTIDIDLAPHPAEEELVFQYFEYQSREPGYRPVFGVHVLKDSDTAGARVVLGRLPKDGKPVLQQTSLDRKTVDLIMAIATPVVRETHYRNVPCPALYLDGYVILAGVNWRDGQDADFIAGEAYVPIPGTPAGQLEVLGRALRDIALKKLPAGELEAYLRAKGIVRNDPPR